MSSRYIFANPFSTTLLIAAVLFSFFFSSCNSKAVDISTLVERNGVYYLPNEDSPFSGEVFSKYSNQQFAFKGFIDKGLFTGNYEKWFANGQLSIQANFASGKYDGNVKEWNEKGILLKDCNYKNGEIEGSCKEYFFEDGSLKKEYVLKSGLHEGNYVEMYSPNNPKIKCSYLKGKLNGRYEEFYQNGIVAQAGNYVDDTQDGEWIGNNSDGTKKFVRNFKNGFKHGIHIEYYRTGPVFSKINYADDVIDGEFSIFDGNGYPKESARYVNGYKNGKYTYTLYSKECDSLLTFIEENYLEGSLDGICVYRNYFRGCRMNKIKTVEYSNGTVISCNFKESYYCSSGLCWSNENCIRNFEDPEWVNREDVNY